MKILVTGSAGFIGFHLSRLLLENGYEVIGVDNYNDYYDPTLKRRRTALLQNTNRAFTQIECDISSKDFNEQISLHHPSIIIHLAAQAGVRYSIDNPEAYVNSNLVGTFRILELAKDLKVSHLLIASTSSVYGANTDMPFSEQQKCDTQISFYAATKKSNESMAHSYSHNYGIPTTMFRFFTVYGPWGRPDMALFKFTKNILSGKSIDVYNNGEMSRDFTFVEDLVKSIELLIDKTPSQEPVGIFDSLSEVAPFRIVNIGNSKPIALMEYIKTLEEELGCTANINFMPMQQGDVQATASNIDLLYALTNYKPTTTIKEGVRSFVKWYKKEYNL